MLKQSKLTDIPLELYNQAYRPSRRQSVFVQQRELEELQERIRQAEARLGHTTDEEDEEESDSSESDTASKEPEPSRARAATYSARQPSIFAIRETKDEEEQPRAQVAAAGAATPVAKKHGQDYVMVRRPRPGPRKHPRVDSHIEISEEDEEEDEDDDDSEEDSSEEEVPVRRR
jgi:hypothetical protein